MWHVRIECNAVRISSPRAVRTKQRIAILTLPTAYIAHRNRRNRQRHDWQDICYSRRRRTFARMAIRSVPNQRLCREDLWKLMSVRPCLAEDTV
jgi:hypothetical protein